MVFEGWVLVVEGKANALSHQRIADDLNALVATSLARSTMPGTDARGPALHDLASAPPV